MRAVDGVDTTIEAGEFFTLLGPSGSGKTTCLRMIGGFAAHRGRVRIGGRDVTMQPPYARPVNTVFQDYALFPHMSIRDNVAYALMVRKVDKAERHRRADELLALVELDGVGGRRRRSCRADSASAWRWRALISQPQVLLLDEPLGALDLKLREQMQSELKTLQRRLGITFLFITHDQHEALSMSDRIGVFNAGKLEQVGTPQQVYDAPATRFVAHFVGAANVLDGAAARLTGCQRDAAPRTHPRQRGRGARASSTVRMQYYGAFAAGRCRRALQADLPHGAPPCRAPTPCTCWDERAVTRQAMSTARAARASRRAPPAVGPAVHAPRPLRCWRCAVLAGSASSTGLVFALLANAFFGLDDFTGRWCAVTLKNFAELCSSQPGRGAALDRWRCW